MKRYLFILVAMLSLILIGRAEEEVRDEVLMPFRGAWIATVANIDWPSAEAVGDSAAQKAEMTFLLDSLYGLGLNAIILQVRPTADALYRSAYEPSSHWLTGKQGAPLTWDPLE